VAVRLGGDYSFARPSMSELHSLGVTFVARYVSPEGSKNLSRSEAVELSNAGIDIVTNFEDTANNSVGGYSQGVADARMAEAQHLACGGPPTRPIYFSIDTDLSPSDSNLHSYFAGIVSVLGAGRTGVYGSTGVCRALKAAGLVMWTWRSMSTGWSGGAGTPGEFNVEQTGYLNSSIDRDASITDDFGQWRVGQSAPPPPNPGPAPPPTPSPSPSGGDLPTPYDVWSYKGNDATGPADQPDVHQSLLTTRDNSAALVAMLRALKADFDLLKSEVAAVKAKLGA